VRQKNKKKSDFRALQVWHAALLLAVPVAAFAQASPFNTGATSLLSFALTIATPIAALLVIALAIAASVGKISWGWVIGAIVGIAAIFGAPQIVAWIRGLFGV
jgi:type IV secretory pathway VirB2 component (pilin)